MLRRIFYILITIAPLLGTAQLAQDYVPFYKTSAIAAAFSEDPVAATKKNVEANTLLDRKEAQVFYSKMNFFKSQLLQSGQLYLSNTVTRYVDSVAAKLLLGEPKLQLEIKIFLTRFTESNAFCFPDGSIFINVGLVASMQNETELAFILAHEIGHYAEQHNVKDVKRLAQIEKEEFGFSSRRSTAYRTLKFSRESEFDADAWAVQLLAQAGYDATQASPALARLKSQSPADSVDLKASFGNETFTMDTAWYGRNTVKKNKSRYRRGDDDPIASGKLDDLFQTHPDLDKRIEAVDIMAKNAKQKTGVPFVIKTPFEHIRELARFERVENNYREQDYLNAVLNALRLLKTYPANIYLHTTISKSLYWLSYYKEISGDETLKVSGDEDENGYDFYRLFSAINQMSLKDTKKLAYAYVRQKSDQYPDKEPILFYLALNTDNYLGKNAARNYYRDYLQKYPNGTYSAATKIKLQ
jgi:Zn-dependent protease with chaperone function